MNEKTFVKRFFILCFICMTIVISIILIADPLFHYHAPILNFKYYIGNERYQNDGISRNFSYDGIITGNSMTENFKTSEFDALFDLNSIKAPFASATYKEINDYLERAISYNSEIKVILRALDLDCMALDADYMSLDSYPEYLYDDNIANDVNYVLNKSVLLYYSFAYWFVPTIKDKPTTTFDEYANWNAEATFHIDSVLAGYERPEKKEGESSTLTEEQKQLIYENIEQNVIALAKENPDIDFYYFYPPYSIAYFDSENQLNTLEQKLEIMEYVTSLILEVENIKLYSYFHEFEIITNLNNYMDIVHYDESINSLLLQKMYEDDGILTEKNYVAYFDEIRNFYINYNYDAIFQ